MSELFLLSRLYIATKQKLDTFVYKENPSLCRKYL